MNAIRFRETLSAARFAALSALGVLALAGAAQAGSTYPVREAMRQDRERREQERTQQPANPPTQPANRPDNRGNRQADNRRDNDHRDGHRDYGRPVVVQPPRHDYRHDGRYDGRHYYRPPRIVTHVPPGYARHYWHGYPYYYNAGYWYRPWGSSFAVVAAPFGLVVPYLPGYYTSFWYGGSRYFRVENTFYLYDAARSGYVVTRSPYGDDLDQPDGDYGDDRLYVYPARGQSEAQTADDRYDCHRWAVGQTGYDPVDSDYDSQRREGYLRAITACLTGRGYTVR